MITPAHNLQGVVYTLHIRKRVFPVTTQKVPEVTYETQNASLLGNVLMGLGLVVMVVGVGIQSSTSYHSLICPSISHMVLC